MYLSQTMGTKSALMEMLKSEQSRMWATIGCAILSSLIELIPWVCFFQAANVLLKGDHPEIYLIAMATAIVLRYVFYTLSVWQAHLVAYHVIQRVRQYIVKALASMPNERLQKFHRGDLEKRISDDCQSLEPLIAHHTTDIISGLLTPVLLMAVLLWIDWRVGLFALSPLPLAAVAQFLMMRGFTKRQESYNQIVSHMHQAQLEFLRSIGVMKLFGVDVDSYRQLSRTMNKHHKLVGAYTNQMVGAWVTFVTLAQASLMTTIPFALYFTVIGDLTHVELAMIVMLCAGILKPWLDLTQIFGQVQQSMLAIGRLIPLFHHYETENASPCQQLKELSCQSLSLFRGERHLFHSVNLSFFPGERIVFQGSSGSGKSSLLGTLSGTVEPQAGGWYYNDLPLNGISDDKRSQLLAVVDQHPKFFTGSLRDNIALSLPDTEDKKIWQLLTLVGLNQLIRDLPEQLETDIGETERAFSGGEIQRLAIVRAALANTPVLILDEATSHLDNFTEQMVLTGLRRFSPNQIQLIISHRTQALTDATHSYRLKDGVLSEIKQKGVVNE
ncbi:ABC transporter ATP-binding protein/permease [Vibrio sp. JC009]|uniref:ATP-binding cassette domain-containing protein n=1 Tax=Vibrio sp. JC009 TaxID=2912314 RepID=UPI0023B08C4B|nr:ABC transporter ATP-binding protein [Vibrio sp. JC009]WED23349.1 ABC transporter ATP-binding protein/permease [Vibrio sp. JC009]